MNFVGTTVSQMSLAVSILGDVNYDGVPDLLIGAPDFSINGDLSQTGRTYLVYGHENNWPSTFSVADINATTGVIFNGVARNDNSGWSVGAAGDVNGDGIDDFLIGARYADGLPGANGLVGDGTKGEAYLIFGRGEITTTMPTTSTSTTTSSSTAITTSSTSTTSSVILDETGSGSDDNTGLIVGLVVFAAIAGILVLAVVAWRRQQSRKKTGNDQMNVDNELAQHLTRLSMTVSEANMMIHIDDVAKPIEETTNIGLSAEQPQQNFWGPQPWGPTLFGSPTASTPLQFAAALTLQSDC